jgi:hypothetical protein
VTIRPFIVFAWFTASVLCACSRASSPVRGVAIVGDSETELRTGIAAAESFKKNPIFVTLRFGDRVEVFSPYAQVLRANGAIVVRAFSSILTFPPSADVRYDGREVDVRSLPPVTLPFAVKSGMRLDARAFAKLTDAWNGLKDPWQRGTIPPPWTKGAILDAQSTDLTP